MSRRFTVFLAAFTLGAFTLVALADDEIQLKGKQAKIKGVIVSESVKGIVLKNGDKYSGDEIEDILYDASTSKVGAFLSYRNAMIEEKEWLDGKTVAGAPLDAKGRKNKYDSALAKYEAAASGAGGSGEGIVEKKAKAHIDFKLGYIRGKKAIEDNDPALAKNAITRLRGYLKDNQNQPSYLFPRALTLLAQLQIDTKDFLGAETSLGDILKLPDLTDTMKNNTMLDLAMVSIQNNKFAAAKTKLDDLLKTLPKGSKEYGRALVMSADCLIAESKVDEAVNLLKQAIKESDDRTMRAVAYNTLGVNYFKKEDYKSARWEFLWVDVVYNQDRNEHARALYYLGHIFERTNDPDKAAQARATLADAGYAGTAFQRKMLDEQKKK